VVCVVYVGVWGCGGVGVGVVSPCVRTFQGLHSVRLWTPTICALYVSLMFPLCSPYDWFLALFLNTMRQTKEAK
jgi:hypothetical protein